MAPAAEYMEVSPSAPSTESSEDQVEAEVPERNWRSRLIPEPELEGPGQKEQQDNHQVPDTILLRGASPGTSTVALGCAAERWAAAALTWGNTKAGAPKQGPLRFPFLSRPEWDSHE